MVRKKVRTVFLLFKKKNSKGKEKGKNSNLTFPKKMHGKEKGKNWILTFQKKSHGKPKVRARSLLLKKKIKIVIKR